MSNLTYYVDSLKSSLKPGALPVKTDDFFPYIENPHVAWTGYFTSKPNFKYFIRKASIFYNAAKLILIEHLIKNKFDIIDEVNEALLGLEQELGIV